MFEAFFKDKLAPLTLRLAVGSVCVYHGFVKIMANGGLTWSPGMPAGWQALLAWGEFGAGVAILLGFRCRIAAAVLLGVTGGTLLWWHGWGVFHMPIRTLEPTLILLLVGLTLLFLGAGELSLDGRAGGSRGASSRGHAKKKQAA